MTIDNIFATKSNPGVLIVGMPEENKSALFNSAYDAISEFYSANQFPVELICSTEKKGGLKSHRIGVFDVGKSFENMRIENIVNPDGDVIGQRTLSRDSFAEYVALIELPPEEKSYSPFDCKGADYAVSQRMIKTNKLLAYFKDNKTRDEFLKHYTSAKQHNL